MLCFMNLKTRKFLENFWDRFAGKLIQSSIGEFWGVTRAVLLENSSRPFFKSFFSFLNFIGYKVSVKIRMDEFSSKTACVTTQKMKILEKILDEFSMICQ